MEVVHSKWLYVADNSTGRILVCKNCKKPYNPNDNDVEMGRAVANPNFCLHCGAKMDEE